MVPGSNVRIREIIDRKMYSCIGIKRMTVLGRTGYPENIPTHVYIHFPHFFELSKLSDDMIKTDAYGLPTKRWIKFVECLYERDMYGRDSIHNDVYSKDCTRCRNYVDGLKEKAVWWFEIGKDKLLRMSFKNFFNDYTTFECCCLWIKIFGMVEVQLTIEDVAEGSRIRRNFRVVRSKEYFQSYFQLFIVSTVN